MPILPAWASDTTLDHHTYLDDFYARYKAPVCQIRKIESGQIFAEPGNPSWEAFVRGDWSRALQRMGQHAQENDAHCRAHTASQILSRRVRIVCQPLTDYLIWELHYLYNNTRSNVRVGIVDYDRARGLVGEAWLDDFVSLDEAVAYRVLYGSDGVNSGAERSQNPTVIGAVNHVYELLAAASTPLADFFVEQVQGRAPSSAIT